MSPLLYPSTSTACCGAQFLAWSGVSVVSCKQHRLVARSPGMALPMVCSTWGRLLSFALGCTAKHFDQAPRPEVLPWHHSSSLFCQWPSGWNYEHVCGLYQSGTIGWPHIQWMPHAPLAQGVRTSDPLAVEDFDQSSAQLEYILWYCGLHFGRPLAGVVHEYPSQSDCRLQTWLAGPQLCD